jgi:hypothetical protein
MILKLIWVPFFTWILFLFFFIQEGYKAMCTFAFDSQKYNMILSHCEGQVPYQLFQKAMELCQKASHVIFDFYRQAVLRKFSKELL